MNAEPRCRTKRIAVLARSSERPSRGLGEHSGRHWTERAPSIRADRGSQRVPDHDACTSISYSHTAIVQSSSTRLRPFFREAHFSTKPATIVRSQDVYEDLSRRF